MCADFGIESSAPTVNFAVSQARKQKIVDGIVKSLGGFMKSKKIEIIPATFKETMALGCNVVTLGGDRVLSTESAKDLNAKMRAAGFTVYDPDMTMFLQAGGGVQSRRGKEGP